MSLVLLLNVHTRLRDFYVKRFFEDDLGEINERVAPVN